jgi:hypothetical protein
MTRTDTGRRPRFRPSLDPLEARETPASLFTASGTIAGGPPLVDVAAPGGATLARFAPFESTFTGGVRAAAGELDGNPATVEVVAVPGPGGGPRVQVYAVGTADGSVAKLADFFALEDTFRDGLRVAVGNLDPSSPTDEIVVGADAGGGPRVRTFNLVGGRPEQLAGPLGNFFAFEDTFRGGVRVAVGNLLGTIGGPDQLVVGAGTGGAPRVQAFGLDGVATQSFFAPGLTGFGGVNVGFGALNGVAGSFRSDALADDFSQRNAALNAPILARLAAAGGTTLVGPGTTGVTVGGTGLSPFTIAASPFNAGITTGPGLVFSSPTTTGLFGTGGFTNGLFNTGGFTNGLFNTGGLGAGVFDTGTFGSPAGSFGAFGSSGTTLGF